MGRKKGKKKGSYDLPQRRGDYEARNYKVYLLKWQSGLNSLLKIERKQSRQLFSPFNPKERLSQQDNITNPILIHSREVLTKVQVVLQYQNICRNILRYGNILPFTLEKSLYIGSSGIRMAYTQYGTSINMANLYHMQ